MENVAILYKTISDQQVTPMIFKYYFAFLPKELLNMNMMEPMLFMKRKKLPKMILPDFVKKQKKTPTFGDSNMNKMELPKLKNLSTPN